ncbi:hypothetical protein ACET3Z_011428 [Daucus carota]
MSEEEQQPEEIKDKAKLSSEKRKNKQKKRFLQEVEKAEKRGVCYLSHIPPKMDHVKLRQLLSQYGEIQRIYLTPENPDARLNRKKAGGFRGQKFSEGWVEFTDKRVAKDVAETLNGEQMGGRKRSPFYYDTWNIKYLSKFKWDDLTEEIAYKSATREQKLALNMSAAKRERDFYLSKVDQSHAQKHIAERLQKKQKVNPEQEEASQVPYNQVIRQYPQTQPLANKSGKKKQLLSKDVLAGVFGLGAT